MSDSNKNFTFSGLRFFTALGLLSVLLAVQSFAQEPQKAGAQKPAEKEKARLEKGAWRVRMSKTEPQSFTVKADEAPIADVANEFAKLLKVPITLSPSLNGRLVTLDFAGLSLEPAVRMLAPKVYVDYELGGDMLQPKPLAIYFYAQNELPPENSVALQNNTQALLIEGHTEEGTEEYEKQLEKEEQVLKITYAKNQLSILARKQPLNVVLYKIASELGIPFDLRSESNEIINLDIKNSPIEQAIRSLSPSARLYYRSDLQTSEIRPLRVAMVGPTASKS